MSWSNSQVESLAPDAASLKAGRQLAEMRKWSGLGQNPRSLWGLCQGSGKDPYQAQVDLSEPAFRCSCPSRKFPCKHCLGVMLLWVASPASLPQGESPGWVSDWIKSRDEKTTRKASASEPKADPEALPHPGGGNEAQAKRAAQRESRVNDGVAFLKTWLQDLLRNGLSGAPSLPESHWNLAGARLVDAQAPGLARLVRRVPEILALPHWQEALLGHLGRTHLLIEAYQRCPGLEPAVQAEIRGRIGWSQSQEQLVTQAGVSDQWCVVGKHGEEDEQLKMMRTWLCGRESRRPALLLEFAAGGRPLAPGPPVGACLQAEIVFFEAAYPLRALLKSSQAVLAPPPSGLENFTELLQHYAQALAVNPWLDLFPVLLDQVTAGSDGTSLIDRQGQRLPLSRWFSQFWRMAALGGGHPLNLFGEWDGQALRPLTVWADGRCEVLQKNLAR